MGEVIKVNFTDIKEDSGYIMDEGKIEGVYKGDLVAHNNKGNCYIGCRGDSEIYNPIQMSVKELNEFCIMWLAIFDPEVLNMDDCDNG